MLKSVRVTILLLFSACTICQLIQATIAPGDSLFADRCPAPRSIVLQDVTDTSAQIFWHASDSALRVDLHWREIQEPDWTVVSGVQSPFTLVGLMPCQSYEVRLQATCDVSESVFSPVVQFVADACCRIPTGIRVLSQESNFVTITWDNVEFAFEHHVRYRSVDDTAWMESSVDINQIELQDLMECAAYEFQVGSQCDLDSTDYSASLMFQTSACGTCTEFQYCNASGDDSSAEWIDSIAFSALQLRTGDNNGYLLRNTVQTGIERKRAYTFFVQPASVIPGAAFYLRMWIDLDQDGIFTDSTELLVDPPQTISVMGWNQQIVIPDSIILGETRMRIALKSMLNPEDTTRPDACGNFLFGEVEDYCVSIDDLCPEVVPELIVTGEHSVDIAWSPVDEAFGFIYRYRKVGDMDFGDSEITVDTLISLSGLDECTDYELQTLSVCVQDTSSWQSFFFKTQCPPDAVREFLPIADNVRVYPVPFRDMLSVSLTPVISGPAVIHMMDMSGAELLNRNIVLHQGESTVITLDALDAFPSGMFLVCLESRQRLQVIKVIKQ